jgi:predicted TPR repeat methyltransferase
MVYDQVADTYDETWTKPSDLAENDQVVALIHEVFGEEPRSVLDAGCGTGLAIDLGIVDLTRDRYVGFDPSPRMLDVLREKYPGAYAECATDEEWLDRDSRGRRFDLVIGLFAAPSYMKPSSLTRLVERANRMAVLMTYDGTWLPDYYDAEHPAPTETFEAASRHAVYLSDQRFKIGAFDVTVVLR